MKNGGLGWQLDIPSTGDNGKMKFFLNECSFLGNILEKMEIIGCEGESQNEILAWKYRK